MNSFKTGAPSRSSSSRVSRAGTSASPSSMATVGGSQGREKLSKRIPRNPKYAGVTRVVDTGYNLARYLEKIEDEKRNYRYRPGELFKRMKPKSFARLVLEYYNNKNRRRLPNQNGQGEHVDIVGTFEDQLLKINHSNNSYARREQQQPQEEEEEEEEDIEGSEFDLDIQARIDAYNNNNTTESMESGLDEIPNHNSNGMISESHRSTLEDLVCGVGAMDKSGKEEEKGKEEVDQRRNRRSSTKPYYVEEEEEEEEEEERDGDSSSSTTCPYLLLDVRDESEFGEFHLIGSVHYPARMLSRSCNYFTGEILKYRNVAGKMLIIVDWDERIAAGVAQTFVERGVDNVWMLAGGLKLIHERFPGTLISGRPNPELLRHCNNNNNTPKRRLPSSSVCSASVMGHEEGDQHVEEMDCTRVARLCDLLEGGGLSTTCSTPDTSSRNGGIGTPGRCTSSKPWK
eukprot:Nk52_evm1s2146 gene=Nk52_evmTU1s2146